VYLSGSEADEVITAYRRREGLYSGGSPSSCVLMNEKRLD
jgi:hypothetical protein